MGACQRPRLIIHNIRIAACQDQFTCGVKDVQLQIPPRHAIGIVQIEYRADQVATGHLDGIMYYVQTVPIDIRGIATSQAVRRVHQLRTGVNRSRHRNGSTIRIEEIPQILSRSARVIIHGQIFTHFSKKW